MAGQPVTRFTTVIFDADGVLLDTRLIWSRAARQVAYSMSVTPPPADDEALIGLSASQVAERIVSSRQDVSAEEATEMLQEWLRDEGWKDVKAMSGATELVAALSRGGMKLAVASNGPTDFVRRAMEVAGFDVAHLTIVGADDSDVNAPKPAPDVYNTARRRLRAAARETVAVEDSPTGALAARRAGLFVVGVGSSISNELNADETFTSLKDVALWDILGLCGEVDESALETLYVETAKVAQAFFDWRNKLMRFTFAAVGAVFAVAGWLWLHRHSGLLASLPLFGGTSIAIGCIYLERRNHEILAQCYAVCRSIERAWGAAPTVKDTARSTRWERAKRILMLPIPFTRVPTTVQSTGGIFTNLELGRRSYFRVLRFMFFVAAILQLMGALYFVHWAHPQK